MSWQPIKTAQKQHGNTYDLLAKRWDVIPNFGWRTFKGRNGEPRRNSRFANSPVQKSKRRAHGSPSSGVRTDTFERKRFVNCEWDAFDGEWDGLPSDWHVTHYMSPPEFPE